MGNRILTKQEIIEKLQSLPDYPVVFQRDCEQLRSTLVTSIEVKDAYKDTGTNEYCDFYDKLNKPYEKVIWIS